MQSLRVHSRNLLTKLEADAHTLDDLLYMVQELSLIQALSAVTHQLSSIDQVQKAL